MSNSDEQHKIAIRLLKELGLDEVRVEQLQGPEGTAFKYYAWGTVPVGQESKPGRRWSTLVIVDESE